MWLSNKFKFMSFFLLFTCSGLLLAGETRVAIVKLEKLLVSSKIGKAANHKLKKEFGGREKKLKGKRKKLGEMMAKARTKRSAKYLAEVEKFKSTLKSEQKIFIIEYKTRRAQEMNKIKTKVKKVINSFGKKEKYDLILYTGIVYNNKGIDITDKVRAALDKN